MSAAPPGASRARTPKSARTEAEPAGAGDLATVLSRQLAQALNEHDAKCAECPLESPDAVVRRLSAERCAACGATTSGTCAKANFASARLLEGVRRIVGALADTSDAELGPGRK